MADYKIGDKIKYQKPGELQKTGTISDILNVTGNYQVQPDGESGTVIVNPSQIIGPVY